jgi:hypothetical protein
MVLMHRPRAHGWQKQKISPLWPSVRLFGNAEWQRNLALVEKLKPLVEEIKTGSLTLLALGWTLKYDKSAQSFWVRREWNKSGRMSERWRLQRGWEQMS